MVPPTSSAGKIRRPHAQTRMSHYFPLSKLHLKQTAAFSTRHRVLGNPVSAGVLTWAQAQATGNDQEDGKAALGWEGAFSSHVPDGLIPQHTRESSRPLMKIPKNLIKNRAELDWREGPRVNITAQ